MAHSLEISNRHKSVRTYAVVAAVLVAALTALYFIDRDIYIALAVEDGVAESLTAVFFLAAGIILIVAAAKSCRNDRRLARQILPVGLGLFFVFIAGEELSWGQRIFHFSLPESMSGTTFFDDLSFHNLKIFGYPLLEGNRLLNMFVILFGIVGPLAAAGWSWIRKLIHRLNFPIAPLATAALFLFALLHGLGMSRVSKHWAPTEIKECLFSLGFLLAAISAASGKNRYSGNELRRERSGG